MMTFDISSNGLHDFHSKLKFENEWFYSNCKDGPSLYICVDRMFLASLDYFSYFMIMQEGEIPGMSSLKSL